MALLTKVGSFLTRGSPGTQAITGVGFQPKAVIFWTTTSNQNSGVWGIFYNAVLGYTTGPSNSFACCAAGTDGVSSTNTTRRMAAKAITMSYNEAVSDEADLQTMDADGFTLNWTAGNHATWGNNVQINYMAIGGSDITGARVVNWTTPTAVGNHSVTGAGFQPDLVLHASTYNPALNSSLAASLLQFGAMNGAGEQWANSWVSGDAANPSVTSRYQRTGVCIAGTTTNEVVEAEASYVSMNPDGFTLNWTVFAAQSRQQFSLCLAGARSKIGSLAKPTAAGPVSHSVRGLGFVPQALMTSGAVMDARLTPSNGAHWTLGGTDGTSSRVSVMQDIDAVSPTQADSLWLNDAMYAVGFGATPSTTTKATSTFVDDGFDLLFNPSGVGSAEEILYLALSGQVIHPPYTPKAGLTDLLREEILADAPYAYYPLDDGVVSFLPGGWDPTQISGLVSWLNPDALPGVSGSLVSSAPAVGANPAWVLAHGSAPYLRRNGLNGRSYIEVHGEPDYRGLVCDINLTGASTVFVVARLRGSGGVPSDPGRVLAGWRNNWLLGWHGSQEDRAYFEGWIYGEGTAAGQTAGPPATTNLRAYAGIFTATGGNDGIFYRNGVKLTEHSAATQGPNGLALAGYMGFSGQSDEHSDSDVYEVIAYNRVLTTNELLQVHDYLAHRHKTITPYLDPARRDASGNGRAAVTVGPVSKGERPLINRGFATRFTTTEFNVIQTPFTTSWPEFTVEVLLHPEGAAANSEVISKRSYFATSATDFPFAVNHGADGKINVVLDGGGDFSADSGINSVGTYARNTTHHVVVVVRNNGLCELYVNGVLDSSVTITFALVTNARAWTLGGPAFENGGGVNGLRFNGKAQHWAIYDKALTTQRIQAHYAAIRKPPVEYATGSYDELVRSGPILGYWRLDETTGAAIDRVGAVDGTYSSGITRGVTGLIDDPNLAATFDGSSGTRVQMPVDGSLDITTGSIEVWFKTSGAGSGHRGIAMRHFWYGMFLYDNVLEIFDWAGSQRRSTGINCADNQVHHAVVTFQSGVSNGTKIYLDGVDVLTTTMTVDTVNGAGGAFVIGAGNPGGTIQNFAGTIDEVAVYSSILTPVQIADRNTLGRAGRPPLGPSGLTALLAS